MKGTVFFIGDVPMWAAAKLACIINKETFIEEQIQMIKNNLSKSYLIDNITPICYLTNKEDKNVNAIIIQNAYRQYRKN